MPFRLFFFQFSFSLCATLKFFFFVKKKTAYPLMIMKNTKEWFSEKKNRFQFFFSIRKPRTSYTAHNRDRYYVRNFAGTQIYLRQTNIKLSRLAIYYL